MRATQTFYRQDECSGGGRLCDRCGRTWLDHIAPGCQCPPPADIDPAFYRFSRDSEIGPEVDPEPALDPWGDPILAAVEIASQRAEAAADKREARP